MSPLEISEHNSAVLRLQIKSLGDFARTVKRQFFMTKGLLFAELFIFIATFTVFPAVVDATSLTWMDNTIARNEMSWF